MHTSYKCMSCETRWTERGGPQDCPNCGHRYVEVLKDYPPSKSSSAVYNDNNKEEESNEGKPTLSGNVSASRVFPSKRHQRPDSVSAAGGYEDDCPFTKDGY